MSQTFNIDQAIQDLRSGQKLNGADGILTPLIKQLVEGAMKAELEQHLEQSETINRKNGSTSKTVKSSTGNFKLDTPRDRAGTFEPQLVKKNQTQLTAEIDQKILSLFSHGMSYRDIKQHITEMYGIDVSTGTINAVTDQLLSELEEWKNRPLDSHYPIVWLDAIHYKIKEDGRYVMKAIYTLLGLNIKGKKEFTYRQQKVRVIG